MRYKLLFTLVILTGVSTAVHAQMSASLDGLILFDPVFWERQLHLKDEQRQEIQAVNFAYYDHLLLAVRSNRGNNEAMGRQVTESALERSEQIWEVLTPRQKRRWHKIMLGYNH